MTRIPSWVFAVAMVGSLVACGGGGDDTPPPGTFATRAAMDHLLTTGGSWTMSGTGPNGQAFVTTIAFSPLAQGPFPINGATTARAEETITVVSGGQSSTGTLTYYFEPLSHGFIGNAADGGCAIATSNSALPETAPVGATGLIFNEADFDGCAGSSAVVGSSVNTWSIEADTGIVLFCWKLTSSDLAGLENGSYSTCIEIAADGTLGSKAHFAVSSAGVVIRARNF